LLVVFAVQVPDLVHQRVAHFAVQLFVVVGGAREVAAVENDGRFCVGRRGLGGRPEEAENAGRAVDRWRPGRSLAAGLSLRSWRERGQP